MNLLCKRIITGICAISITFSCVVPAFAASPSVSSEITGFWESLVHSLNQSTTGGLPPLNFLFKYAISSLAPDVCAQSEDGHHHGNPTGKTYHLESVEYEAKCTVCGELFRVSEDTVSAAYNEYVSTLLSSGVSSAGNLLWQPNWKDATGARSWYSSSNYSFIDPSESYISDFTKIYPDGPYFIWDYPYQVAKVFYCGFAEIYFPLPITGYYQPLDTECVFISEISEDGVLSERSVNWSFVGFNGVAGSSTYRPTGRFSSTGKAHRFYARFSAPVFSIVPADQTVVTNNYTVDTRVTNFVGNFYNETTNNYYNNITVVNETTNKYYDILSGNYINFKSWTYDYTSRTYILTLDDDTTVAVQFGPDVLTITHPDNTTDTIHYTLPGSGTPEQPDTPSGCAHQYVKAVDVAPTCLESGHATYTCSLCADTYEQILPAAGHTWSVKEHVNTVYNEDGSVLVQGHTLYECTVCGEQFWTDSVSPPPDSSGSSILAFLLNFQTWLGAQLELAISKIQVTINNTDVNIENVLNVVIEETNNAYNVFYVTTGDGEKKSIGEVAGDTLSASGKLLNFLYKLCFEGAFSRVDDSITDMDGFFFDSGAGLEGNIWD